MYAGILITWYGSRSYNNYLHTDYHGGAIATSDSASSDIDISLRLSYCIVRTNTGSNMPPCDRCKCPVQFRGSDEYFN